MSAQQSIQNIPSAVIHNQQHPALTYNQPSIQNMQVDEIEYGKRLAIENDYPDLYVCTLCKSYTKFTGYTKLERHVE